MNLSVWLMYHAPGTDGRCWGRDTDSPCIRACIVIRPISDHLRVDVMTHRGNQTPSKHSAYSGGTRAATALQSSLHYIIFMTSPL